MIPIFVRKALAGEPLTIAGDGLQSRRFVYVEDLAEGVVRGLEPQAGGRVYNLVGDESVTIREIADAVRDVVGDVEIVHTRAARGGLRRGARSRAPAPPPSSAGDPPPRSPRGCAATWTGTVAPRPSPTRRRPRSRRGASGAARGSRRGWHPSSCRG